MAVSNVALSIYLTHPIGISGVIYGNDSVSDDVHAHSLLVLSPEATG
jgi:hypothetical protein